MPCEVRILEVEGTQNNEGSLVSLSINGDIVDSEGNSHENEEIRVEITCSKYDYIITEVNDDQSWNVVFVESVLEQLVCKCFERIQITAHHLPDGTCASGSYDAATPCPCPVIRKISHEPGTCQNGKREITLYAHLKPGNLERIRSTIDNFTWDFDDTVVSFIEDETTNSLQSAAGFTESANLTIPTSDEEPHEDGLTLADELAMHTTGKLLFPAPGVSEIVLPITFGIITEDLLCLDTEIYVLKYDGCEGDCKDITEFHVDFGECDEENKKKHVFFSVDQEITADTYTWKVDGQEITTSTNSADMWLDATGDTEYNITVTSSGPGDCSSEITDTFNVPACRPCKDIKHISVSEGECNKKKNKRKVTITAGQEIPADSYTWTVDGQTTTTSSNSVTIWLDAPGTYTVEVKSDGPGSCSSRLKRTFSVSGCNGNGKNGWKFPGCCVLIYAYLYFFLEAWILVYIQAVWYIILAAFSIASTLIILWVIFCCRKCAKEFWKFLKTRDFNAFGGNKGCCIFIKWQILAHQLVILVLGFIGGGSYWVIGVVGVMGAIWAALFYALDCKGGLPAIFWPPSWPRCKCKKKWYDRVVPL